MVTDLTNKHLHPQSYFGYLAVQSSPIPSDSSTPQQKTHLKKGSVEEDGLKLELEEVIISSAV